MIYTTLLSALFRVVYGEPKTIEPSPDSGLVLVADGIGGLHLCAVALKYVMGAQGSPHVVRLHSWGHGFGRWFADLTDVAHLQIQADLLVDQVKEWHIKRPGTPIFLVGKSGGTGVVVRALEQLEPDTIEAVVLLAAALSPEYDLSRALAAVRHETIAYWSPLDVFILGIGTSIFGTIDRKRSVSAGLVGFKCDSIKNEKFHQIRWQPKMIMTGHFGGHVGPDSPAFLRKYVVPYLTKS
jgi:pimeloyl-ACP methyl ester carboxylesterase